MKKTIVFSVGFLVIVGALVLADNRVSAVTYKFSVFDEVRVISSVPKLDVWSWYEATPTGPATLVGSEVAGNKGVIRNWPHAGKWAVEWKDGLTGWSDEASLEKIPIAAPSAYKIGDWVLTKDSVNLRISPSITSKVYKTLNPGVSCNLKEGPTMADGYYWWGATCNLPKMTNLMLYIAEGSWLEKTTSPALNQPPVISGVLGPTTLEAYEGGFWTWSVTDSEGDAYACNKTKWGDGIEDYEDSHFYVQAGSYTITFSCQDAWGAVGSATATVTVTPSTIGNPPGGATIGGKAFFKPAITGSFTLSPDQDGQWSLSVVGSGISLTFIVDWGDGSKNSYTPDVVANGSIKIVAHKYSAPGIYNIKFTATDNASGVKGMVVTSVGVLDPAMVARFSVGTKVRTKGEVTVMNILGSKDPATNQSFATAELGSKLKYSVGKVSDVTAQGQKIIGMPLVFWGGDWWVRIAFASGEVGWVKESQLEEMCPPLSAAQLSSQARFAEGECVWILGSLASSLSVRGSVPVSGYPFYGDPSPLGTVKGGNQGVVVSGPTATNDFVWWQVSWDNGLQGWSAGNWIASERSKPKSLGGAFTPNSTTTIYFSPQGGRVVGQPVNPNGSIVGRWWANTAGAIGWPEFVGGKWWYKVTYTPLSMPTLRGWSREEDLYGAGTPGNDVVVTPPSCAAKFIPGDRVMIPPNTFPAMAFSYSDPPGGNLGGDLSLDGRLGTVRNGPQRQNNVCWWQVSYDYPSSRPTLWTDVRYLQGLGNVSGTSTGINIISPATGEVWNIGDTMVIRWTAPTVVTRVHIYLSGVGIIASDAPNTGSYSWVVPAVLNGQALGGSTLAITVYAADPGVVYFQTSGQFTIGSGSQGGCANPQFGANELVRTTANLNVRVGPGLGNSVLGQQPLGSRGRVSGSACDSSNTYRWWSVDFDLGPDGWVVQDYLIRN